ncbi:MAG: TraB/VirB10 family protein [Rickettsia endosymbiont of Platyusa sonomae]|nr:TraB/VirB10 family protein [Rickettsia endosymbiont of Platyusa sonomae]
MNKDNLTCEEGQSKTANKIVVSRLQSNFSNKLLEFMEILKNKPVILLACSSVVMILIFYYFSEPAIVQSTNSQEERTSRVGISGVAKAVDPRAKWTAELLSEVKNMKNQLESLIESKAVETKTQLDDFNQKLELLENQSQSNFSASAENTNTSSQIRLQDLADDTQELESRASALAAKRRLGYVKRAGSHIKKDVKDYITTGSFARAVLLTGTVVGTGTNNAAEHEPIMLRLVDTAIFSKGNKTEQIKEAILTGSCKGDISSERAKCHINTISLLNRNGDIVEKEVQGWLIGEDGRPGIKGMVVDRSSDVARMAVLNGVLSGIAQFFQNQATSGIFPISPITGQQRALKSKDSLKGGIYAGTGNALDRLADFAIKRVESMSPVIVVASGRVVDVVFIKGFYLKQDEAEDTIRLLPPTTTDYAQSRTNNYDYHHYNSNEDSQHVSSFSNIRQTAVQSTVSKGNAKLKEHFIKESEEEEYENNTQDNLNNVDWHDQLEQPKQQGNF